MIASMRILIRHATIIPMTTENAITTGSIAIDGRRIVAIGEVPPDFKADKIIDADGMIALPGFVNSHTHASMTYFRNYRDSVSDLHQWLEEIWKLEALLIEDDTYPASLLAAAEMISSGTTCFSDMYFFPGGTARAVTEAGLKANIGLTLFGDEEDSMRRIEQRLPQLRSFADESSRHIRFDIAPHAVYTCTPGTYRLAAETALQEGCRVHTHASETRREVDQCLGTYGSTPIAHLERLGVLNAKSYLAHCVHPTEHEMELLGAYHTTVVHNPSSNCKLGSGIAPVSRMHALGIPIALGTDGPSSNNTLDMFQDLRLASMLAAASTGNPRALSPFQLLRMATIEGAKALGREQECGSLEIGKDADILLLDTTQAHMTPLHDPYGALIHCATSSDVKTVICAGKILMENRELKTIDPQSVRSRFLANWEKIKVRAR